MKKIQMTLVTGMALLWTGCTTMEQPSINKAKEIVTLENGKKYSVPVGSSYTREPVTKKAIQRYTELGVKDCQEGDITWESQSVANGINKVMREGAKEEGIAIIEKAAKEGNIGCASALK